MTSEAEVLEIASGTANGVSVAILRAGIAGLVAAYELFSKDHNERRLGFLKIYGPLNPEGRYLGRTARTIR